MVGGDETRVQHWTAMGKATAPALKRFQCICQREKYCLVWQMRRTILTWKIPSWVFGTVVANWEVHLRPDRDGSTNLGRLWFDLWLSHRGARRSRGGGFAHCWPSPLLLQFLLSWPVTWKEPGQVWMPLLGAPGQDWVPLEQNGWQQSSSHIRWRKERVPT